ncbi:MAG: hypothetical protein M4579_003639 [Chaenotheca gracillima]|nr:MAG: hypothetical protein M4579_003639 [Chaenotheca gracillima]
MASISSSQQSAPKNYIRSGIGGAGNYHKSSKKVPVVIVHHPRPPTQTSTQYFSTGIGGAGNRHKTSEAALFARTDQSARLRAQDANRSETRYFGIGGAGNLARRDSITSRPYSRRGSGSTDAASKRKEKYKKYFPATGRQYIWRKIVHAFGADRSASPAGTELRTLTPTSSFPDNASAYSGRSMMV